MPYLKKAAEFKKKLPLERYNYDVKLK